jgi:hypothetical protein
MNSTVSKGGQNSYVEQAMEIIIGAAVLFFVIRFFYVMGRAKSTSEKNSSDGREIYSLCKARGMDVSDIHSVEHDPRAMGLVKERLSKISVAGRNEGRARNEMIADCIHAIWQRKEKSFVAYSIMNWGVSHGLPQFDRYINGFTKGDPLSISEEDIDDIYSFKVLSAEVGFFGRGNPITYIPDEVFMLPNLECLYFGKGGYPENFSVELERIPESIQKAKKLKYLHLQYCGLTELPRHIFTPWLEELKIGGNDIKIIPDGIENATSLRMLTAWMNDLEYVSEKIGTLRNLKRIDFSANPNLKLPKSIVNLGEMDEMYIDEDLPHLTTEQLAWLKKNNSFIREVEEDDEIPF